MNFNAIDLSILSIDETVGMAPERKLSARKSSEFRPRKVYSVVEIVRVNLHHIKHKDRIHEKQMNVVDAIFAVLLFRSTMNIGRRCSNWSICELNSIVKCMKNKLQCSRFDFHWLGVWAVSNPKDLALNLKEQIVLISSTIRRNEQLMILYVDLSLC